MSIASAFERQEMFGKAFAYSSLLFVTAPAMAQQIMVLDEAEVMRQLEISRHTGMPVLAGRIRDVPVTQAPILEPLLGEIMVEREAGPLQPLYIGPGGPPPGYRDLNGQAEIMLTERKSTINFDLPRGVTRYAGEP